MLDYVSRVFFAGVVVLSLAGCSEGGPETVPVHGTVTFVGRETPKVYSIFFQPVKVEGIVRPAIADADASGFYEARAFKNSRGLIPGTYTVQVTYYDLKPGANPDLESSWIPTNYDAGELVVDANAGDVEHDIEVLTKNSSTKSKS